MKALVTGASGFVGRHLGAYLLSVGDRVRALDRLAAEPVDITDADAVRRAVEAANPDVVYHLAARSHVGQSWRDGDLLQQVNVAGTANVLDACVHANVARLVGIGSAEQYGPIDPNVLAVTEAAPMAPITPYGETKVAAEGLARAAYRDHGLAAVWVRAFNHTGPGQPPTFLVPGLATRIVEAERAGHEEVAVGNLDPVRDFTDVRDVVRAYRLLAEQGEPGEAYNVCSGQGVAVSELAARLIMKAARPLTLVEDPALARPVDIPRLVGSPAKLATATGWAPEYDLDRTLGDVLDWVRSG
ncbi:MAG: GDP-mannose 4,6-dehydratase [Acidimicrobiia bacterium]